MLKSIINPDLSWKKASLILGMLLVMLLAMSTSLIAGTYSGGDGSSGDPYQIANLTDLGELSTTTADWATGIYFIQTADINAAATSGWNGGAGFSPIGNGTTQFTGSYDGDGHTINSLYINRSSTGNIGLFGYISGATIQNIGVTNINITGGQYTGGLVGYNYSSSTVSNSYSTGSVSGTGYYVGGLVGRNNESTVSNSYSTGSVSGTTNYVGGLVGENYRSTVSNSYSTGSVSGDNKVGGLVGQNNSSPATVSNSYSTGSVSGNFEIGGLVGQNYWGATVSNSYSTGSVSGTGVGGLVGANFATVSNSFWDTVTSGTASSAGGTGKTTAEMKTQSTFTGWDFATPIWKIDGTNNDGYPYLSWESYPPPPTPSAIPTLNEWGMIILFLLTITAGFIAIRRRRA